MITPALDSTEQGVEAAQAAPARTESAPLDQNDAINERAVVAQRASRTTSRRTAGVRPAAAGIRRPIVLTSHSVRGADGTVRGSGGSALGVDGTPWTAEGTPWAAHSTAWAAVGTATAERAVRAAQRAFASERTRNRPGVGPRTTSSDARVRVAAARRTASGARLSRPQTPRRPAVAHLRAVVTKHAAARPQRVVRLGSGMTAVVAYARSQVGKRYVSGGEGPGGFDCSGFTKTAYARAGIRLPHSSGAQAARAHAISRSQARPGDLVVGSGHVGIYMGKGMMIDAGNRRTGVVYRKLYSGLRVERL